MSTAQQSLFKPLIISLLAALAMMAVWFTLSAGADDALCWFALVAASDIALLERWLRSRDQRSPAWIAPALTLLCCIASLWLITALNVSYATGFGLHESAGGMGSGLFRALLAMRLQPLDWLLLAASPLLALVLANAGISDRRQSP
ncbi:hypothetical protein [Arenimonas sp. GDDSR-1]|uniref:hypothetical protein n=1 Tax=Arenimonas sp. GDDSR-1 TaxID=2950125 RepID=UPI0026114F07|nr:hypothetical protein [Arenimonas sp. GDDSR-1]